MSYIRKLKSEAKKEALNSEKKEDMIRNDISQSVKKYFNDNRKLILSEIGGHIKKAMAEGEKYTLFWGHNIASHYCDNNKIDDFDRRLDVVDAFDDILIPIFKKEGFKFCYIKYDRHAPGSLYIFWSKVSYIIYFIKYYFLDRIFLI